MKLNFFSTYLSCFLPLCLISFGAQSCFSQKTGENQNKNKDESIEKQTLEQSVCNPKSDAVVSKVEADFNGDNLSDMAFVVIIKENSTYLVNREPVKSDFFIRRLTICVRNEKNELNLSSSSDKIIFPVFNYNEPNPPSLEVNLQADKGDIVIDQTNGLGNDVALEYEIRVTLTSRGWEVIKRKIVQYDIHSEKKQQITLKRIIPLAQFDIESQSR